MPHQLITPTMNIRILFVLAVSLLLSVALSSCDSVALEDTATNNSVVTPDTSPHASVQSGMSDMQLISIVEHQIIPHMHHQIQLENEESINNLLQLINEVSHFLEHNEVTESNINYVNNLNDQLNEYITILLDDSHQSTLNDAANQLINNNPNYIHYNTEQICLELENNEGNMQPFGSGSCQAACASTAAFNTLGIEAGFVVTAIGCAGLTVGYGLCIGGAILTKNALLAGVASSLIGCITGCDSGSGGGCDDCTGPYLPYIPAG